MIKTKLSFDRLFIIAVICMLTCCDDNGGCLEGGNCTHPWDTLPGSCAKDPAVPDGTVGGTCYENTPFGAALCDTGGRCDDKVCIPCGAAGGTCCDDGNGNGTCLDGSTCGEGGEYGICDATCGTLTPGKDTCCAGNHCGDGLQCLQNTNKCVAFNQPTCEDQTQNPTTVVFQDAHKCAKTSQTFRAKPQDLAGCITSFQMATGYAGHCTPGDVKVYDNFCGSSNMWPSSTGDTAEICTTESAADVTECEKETCNNCTIEPDDSCT